MKNESLTLFIPLYGKALMSKDRVFPDETAERIVASVDFDFSTIDTSKKLAIYMAMRAAQYDELAESHLAAYPDSTVIQLGCGLDSRCVRIKAKPPKWYDLDLPVVISIRRQYYPETEEYKMLPSSVTDLSWLDSVEDNGKPVLILAEGLTMYLTEQEVVSLMTAFKSRFKCCSFVFDACSRFAAKMSKIKNPINAVNAEISFSLDNPASLESKVAGAKCSAISEIITEKYVSRLGGIYKKRFKFMQACGKKLYRIFRFEIVHGSFSC